MIRNMVFGFLAMYRRFRLAWLKLKGKTPENVNEERIVTGKSWDEFCDNLKAAGAALVFNGAPRNPFDQAEGYRYLTRLTRASLEAFVEFADPEFPVLRRMVHETVKMGADNPDNYYQNAKISGENDYRIYGNRGTVHYLGFGTQRGDYGKTGKMEPSGYLEGSELKIQADRSFQIILSAEKKPGNWLPMKSDSSLLVVRQTFLDRESESLAELTIEKIGGSKTPDPITPKTIDEGLAAASAFVAAAPMLFSKWAFGFQKHVNKLPRFDPAISNAVGGDDNIAYYHSYWKLLDNEALVIDTQMPECDHWNFQLNNYWMESLDYRYFQVHTNKHLATYRPDGSVRIIVAHGDPRLPNWINTAGHDNGTMCFRWIKAKQNPEPRTRVVEFEKLQELNG